MSARSPPRARFLRRRHSIVSTRLASPASGRSVGASILREMLGNCNDWGRSSDKVTKRQECVADLLTLSPCHPLTLSSLPRRFTSRRRLDGQPMAKFFLYHAGRFAAPADVGAADDAAAIDEKQFG